MNSLLVFGLLAALLTLFALWVLLRPLLRHEASPSIATDQDRRLVVLRDRKFEIEADRDAGRLSADDAGAAIERLAVELSETMPTLASRAPLSTERSSTAKHSTAEASTGMASATKKLLATAIAVLLPLASISLYMLLGEPRIISLEPSVARGETTPAQVAQEIAEFKQRSQKDPNDLQAWALLAQAHRMQGELDEAIAAFKKAGALAPAGTAETARLLAEHAETLLMKRQGDFAGEPMALLEQALRNNPDDQKALGLIGAGHYRLGNAQQGLGYLRKLMTSLPADSEQSRQIAAVIQRIEGELSATGAPPEPVRNGSGSASASASATRAAASNGEPLAGKLSGSVRIAAELAAKIPANATVFIVARPADGQRMPVAVARQPYAAQPFEFQLGDQQSMTAERKLSSYESVVLEARVSASGNAIRQSGDLFGVSKPLKPGAAPIDLLIDQVVP